MLKTIHDWFLSVFDWFFKMAYLIEFYLLPSLSHLKIMKVSNKDHTQIMLYDYYYINHISNINE